MELNVPDLYQGLTIYDCCSGGGADARAKSYRAIDRWRGGGVKLEHKRADIIASKLSYLTLWNLFHYSPVHLAHMCWHHTFQS